MTLTVYGRRNSSNVQKVMWLLGEMGTAHEHVALGGAFGGLDAPEFRAMNPHGLVPVVRDGDAVVWESHAILRYLAARHGGARFWPDDPAARAAADQWMDWSQTEFQIAFITGVFWGAWRTPPERQDRAAIARNVARCADCVRALDAALEGRDYLGGDEPSLADIPAGSLLYRYYAMDIERPDAPRVEAWYERLRGRPAYAEHVMVPFDDLRGRSAY